MSANLWKAGTSNAFSTTLNGSITSGDASITLTSVTGLQYPGIIVVDRVDSNNVATPTAREYISFTGITSQTLTGCSRGLGGSTAQSHSSGAVVEEMITVSHWNDLRDALLNILDSAGALDETKVVDLTTAQALTNKALGSGTTFSADPSLDTGVNIKVNGADPKRTMYIPASAMYPSTTSPCATLTQVESTTNDVNIKVLDFDGSGTSKEYAEFGVQSPSYWDGSTVTAQFIWYASAGSGTVNWEIQGLALSDDDALDTAYGTLQEVTDTLLATGDVHITAETSAITIAGSPTAGDWLQFKIARDPANDTNTSDARLMGVRIRFGIAQYNDA